MWLNFGIHSHCVQGDLLIYPSHSSPPPSPLALCVCLFTCCGVWSPPVEWASCSEMSTFSVLVCFTPTQVTPHQVMLLAQQVHSQLMRTQWWTWTGLRSVTFQRAVYIVPFATQCHSCPVEPALSFALLVLSCMYAPCLSASLAFLLWINLADPLPNYVPWCLQCDLFTCHCLTCPVSPCTGQTGTYSGHHSHIHTL